MSLNIYWGAACQIDISSLEPEHKYKNLRRNNNTFAKMDDEAERLNPV